MKISHFPFYLLPFSFFLTLTACDQTQSPAEGDSSIDTLAIKQSNNSTIASSEPLFVRCLIDAYPDQQLSFSDDSLRFPDGTSLPYDDGLQKTIVEMLDNADIEDMAYWLYPDTIEAFNDAGRIRNELFLKKMYGSSANEVSRHLTTVVWCPNIVNTKIPITTVNNVDKQLQKVSDELDTHPEWKPFLSGISTVNWRVVAGTNRLSPHSWGFTVDIGVPMSNYWKWDYPRASETDTIAYRNRFPKELVDIFEKHGFIWGGRWYHYDNMHFEYRPEILLYRDRK